MLWANTGLGANWDAGGAAQVQEHLSERPAHEANEGRRVKTCQLTFREGILRAAARKVGRVGPPNPWCHPFGFFMRLLVFLRLEAELSRDRDQFILDIPFSQIESGTVSAASMKVLRRGGVIIVRGVISQKQMFSIRRGLERDMQVTLACAVPLVPYRCILSISGVLWH